MQCLAMARPVRRASKGVSAVAALALAVVLLLLTGEAAWAQEERGSVATAIAITVALLGLFLFPPAAWFILTGRKALNQAREAGRWPTAAGTVLESRVEKTLRLLSLFESKSTKTEESKHTYTPVVRYEYHVAGARHEGGVIRFGLTSEHSSVAEKIVARYPQGAAVAVHYNPEDPASAVLESSASTAKWRIGGGVVIALVPFVIGGGLWWLALSSG